MHQSVQTNILLKLLTDKNYQNKKFFRFPNKNNESRAKWFQILNLNYTDMRSYLCEEHFNDTQFTDSAKTRLSKFAVPFSKPRINILQNIQLVPPQVAVPFSKPKINIIQNIQLVPPQDIDTPVNNTDLQSSRQCPFDISEVNGSIPIKRARTNFVLSEIGENRVRNLTPRKKNYILSINLQKTLLAN